MIRSLQYYHDVVNNFIFNDLQQLKYDNYQHKVNLYCFLRDLYNETKSEFDITKDDLSALNYLNNMLNETQKMLCYYRNKELASQIN